MEKTKNQLVEEIAELSRQIEALKNDGSPDPVGAKDLKTDNELYRSLVEQANQAILVIQDEKIRYVNKKTTEITGYPKKELQSNYFIELIHPEDRKLISELSHCHRAKSVPQYRECRILDKNQNARWVEAKIIESTFNSRKVNLCFLIDITDRKLKQEALYYSETKYRQLYEHALAGIYEVDLTNGKFINFNDAICEYTGYSRDEFFEIQAWDLLTEKSRDKQLIRYDKILKGEPVSPGFEFEMVDKNGKILPILAYTQLEYKDGKPHRAHVIAHDITDRKKMEGELNKAQKLESLGVLAGGIGHDFNNLLSGIMGNISLAKLEAERGEDIMESLDEALRVASKASALTQQLLVFSKGGAPVKKAASITEVLHDSTAFTLRGSKIKCDFDIAKDLWPVKVDLGQFSQVIHNLVLNALQAMSGGGGMRLEATNVHLERITELPLIPGRYVVIKIQDQGEGIPEEYLPKIFDLYFTTKSKGNGLGLSMSYTTINRHDGHITVDSNVGEGTTFTIYLPATEEVPEEIPKMETRVIAGEGRVLVMDDEEILRKVAEKMLLELGYEVECVQDGTEALEYYQKAKRSGQCFDAVIMDLTIPGAMGGKKTIKKLLKIDPGAVAIVSSGYSNDPIMSDYEKYGFRGVVTKPYQIEELSWVMRDVMKTKTN